MALKVEASAPSNIALIKYMGKSESSSNRPANTSLSYTLENLRTFVTIEEGESGWQPLPGYPELQLSEKGRLKFLNHFERLWSTWNLSGSYLIRSANNFPSDCGLASSASSFAALTLAAYELARRLRPELNVTLAELSRLSRLGSGSSCRSLFSPWAVWRNEGAEAVDLPLRLEHAVVMVEDGHKAVSSSEAHLRVTSSLIYEGRPARAEHRLEALRGALAEVARGSKPAWHEAYELCWSEFWDMHALFETSRPAFGYMNAGTLRCLNHMRHIWQSTGDGPLVTMDAGPNVHLLFRQEQKEEAAIWLKGFDVMTSWGLKS
ncbi:MAG: diphosphomevalonate decarboxylase [Bdellovibrionales bacterium]|nr:diphosphomevalonate decarboxylase [Bdellovibrionales bacterium]